MAIAAGERIGPYEIQAPLGAGGMGEVYVAVDTRLRRRVAIKHLLESASKPADLRRRALNEARAAAQLNHPNIAAVYDVVETGDAALIVMEYVEGQTLAARLQQGPVSFSESIRIVAIVAEALAAAHRAGVVHRDLKPANILLTPAGDVKILDFGIARITEPSEQPGEELTTAVGQLAGTPAYMPPERILGRTVDHRGDIYSLGVVLFELLTGRLPFTAPDVFALLTRIATQPAPAAHRIDPRVPAELGSIAKRAMAADPADRYATADALRADLLRHAPRTAETGTAVAPLPAARRHPRLPLLLALLVLVTAGAGAFVAWRYSQAQPAGSPGVEPTTVAVLPLANNTGESRNDYLGVGISDVLAAGLVTLPNVNVVSCSVATECLGGRRDTRTAAERLGASLLVEGGVQRQEDIVSVSLRLADLSTNTVLWGREYTAPLSDLLQIQRRMQTDVAGVLRQRGSPGAAGGDTVAGTSVAAGTASILAFEQYSQARLLLERADIRGHTPRAIELLRSAVDQDGTFALAHAALGQAYWLMYEETRDRAWTGRATQAILEALRLDSSQPQVRLSLATIYLGTGELEKAAAEAKRALELHPQNDEGHRLLAAILVEQGHTEEALAEARAALGLRPRFWRNHSQLGFIRYRQGQFEDAAGAYQESIRLQPDSARPYHMLGSVYLAMGNPDAAIGPIMRGNEIQPDAVSLSNLGTIHYWAGRYKEAAAAYRQAVQLRPKEPLHYRNLGDALQRLGARKEATEAYARAVRFTEELLAVSPGDVNTRAMLAVYLAKLGNHARAADEIRRALAANRDSEEVWYRKAVVHALAGEAPAALDALEEAIRRGASRPVAAQDEDLASLRKHPRFEKLIG